MRHDPLQKPASPGRDPLILGLLAFLSVALTIGDPGITLDERLDVAPGRGYVRELTSQGWNFWSRAVVDRTYRHNAEHPPLGRWLLGVASTLGQPVEAVLMGPDPIGVYIRAGRMAPALCFGVLVGLIARASGRRYGRAAGWSSGFALAIMPRMFAHAHFGALDTFVGLFWTLAFLKMADAIESPRPVRGMMVAGLFWGVILLTKIHGWLLVPIVGAWALIRLPIREAIPAVVCWGCVGLLVFVLGWPWLWYDSYARTLGYFQTGVLRSPIRVQYFGRIVLDHDLPWHYPWLYFAATVPIGLHLLGGFGVVKSWLERRDDPFPLLLIATILGFLLLFSAQTPVYDGERLFLPVFPLWAILIGRGFAWLWDDLEFRPKLRLGLVLALLAQASGVVTIHPFGLSYYNSLVGGLPGAEYLGLELTFWGDSVDPVVLDHLAEIAPEKALAAIAPTPVPDHGKVDTNRALWKKSIVLEDESALNRSRWVVIWRREAYWSAEVRRLVESTPPLWLRKRQGVWIAGIWDREWVGH